MAAALTLLRCGEKQRKLRLFDTFEGMPAPTENDQTKYMSSQGIISAAELLASDPSQSGVVWARSPLEEVRHNLSSIGYPSHQIEFVKGRVEETLPTPAISQIALLRLDTDWYESTRHELVHLYPRLERRGVLIIDDYGHWEGARKAVDEYIAANSLPLLLNRIDYTGRIAIKP